MNGLLVLMLAAVTMATSLLWSTEASDPTPPTIAQAFVQNNIVYVGTRTTFTARDIRSGKVLWRRRGVGVPADVIGNAVVATTTSGVALLSADDGELRHLVDACGNSRVPKSLATNGAVAVAICQRSSNGQTSSAVFFMLNSGRIIAVRDTSLRATSLPARGLHFGVNRYGVITALDGAGGAVWDGAAIDLQRSIVGDLTQPEDETIHKALVHLPSRTWCTSGPPLNVMREGVYEVMTCGGVGEPLQVRVVTSSPR